MYELSNPAADDETGTDFYVFGTPEPVPLDPSTKYGMKLIAPLVMGLVLVAALLTSLILRYSRRQEQLKLSKTEGKP
jgi:hypothetical protein